MLTKLLVFTISKTCQSFFVCFSFFVSSYLFSDVRTQYDNKDSEESADLCLLMKAIHILVRTRITALTPPYVLSTYILYGYGSISSDYNC